jgi:hypothetical protein
MKSLSIVLLATVISLGSTLGFATTASAGNTNSPRIDRREANQQRRINQGVTSGSLTPKETYRLQRQQGSINAQEARFKSNGHLSNRERNVLDRRLNNASKNIYRAKHN